MVDVVNAPTTLDQKQTDPGLERTFWLSDIVPKESVDYEDIVENCDWQPVASQIAMNYFVGCDYQESEIGCNSSVKEIKNFFDTYCETYLFCICEGGVQRWFFQGSDENGKENMSDEEFMEHI
jgi:hypothetical protein